MYIDDFESLVSHYKKGVKKISFRNSRPTIAKGTLDLKLEKFASDYDLIFNKEGRLLNSIHFYKLWINKVYYGYDRTGKLITALKLEIYTNELIDIDRFTYDKQGRIISEEGQSYFKGSHPTYTETRIHNYSRNKETIFIRNDNIEEDDYILYISYGKQHQVIEEKAFRNETELISWDRYKYDIKGKLIKSISLTEKGTVYYIAEYEYFENGLDKKYMSSSKEENFKADYYYEYNEKGDWILQVVSHDGEPRFIYDRTIEYY